LAVIRIGRILTGRSRAIPGAINQFGFQGHTERSRALRTFGIRHGDLRGPKI